MSNLRQPIYVVLSVVGFLVLSVIAAVEYSGNESRSNDIRGQAFYKIAKSLFETTEKVLSAPAAVNVQKTASEPELRESLKNEATKYINIEKTQNGWEIILQTKEKVIFHKIID